MSKSGIKVKTKDVFETTDELEFDTLEEAEEHESHIAIGGRLEDNEFEVKDLLEECQDSIKQDNFTKAAELLCQINALAGIN